MESYKEATRQRDTKEIVSQTERATGAENRDGRDGAKSRSNEDAGIPPHNLQTPKNDLSVFGFRKFDLRRLFGQLIKPNKLNKLKNRKPMKQISF